MEIELVVHCVILERTRPELIFLGRRRAVRWKLKATLDTPVDGRERDFVPIERGTPLVEKHTPRRELRLAHSLLLFPPLDASFDGVDSASDGFLNEVCVTAEVVAVLVGNDEFDRRGTPELYISDVAVTVVSCLGVR